MTVADTDWFDPIWRLVHEEHGATTDRLGRPWSEHFLRVATRLEYRRPGVKRPAIEAALMHDALMAGGRGVEGLRKAGLSNEAIGLIKGMTPPPYANYFRDLKNVTPEENAIYFEYIQRIIGSGDADLIYLKLADVSDTIDSLAEARMSELNHQLHNRYLPSRDMLFAWTLSNARDPATLRA